MSSIIRGFLWSAALGLAGVQSVESEVLEELQRGMYRSALARVERALMAPGAGSEARERLEELRARCLFEMGDYPACEAALRGILERQPGSSSRRRSLETQLARVLHLEGAYDEALALAGKVVEAGAEPEARRLVLRILLERRRYSEVGPHAGALLASRPDDPLALFARGVAAAKAGEFGSAIADLQASALDASLRRSALFELALAYSRLNRPRDALAQLYAILSADPFDVEACHQLGQQLLRVKDRRQVRVAAQVLRYFESLKSTLGASSRDHHLAAAGRGAEADLERAGRWERAGDMARAVEAVRRAWRIASSDPAARARVAEFWFRQGLLAEGEAALAPSGDGAGTPIIEEALEHLAALRAGLRQESGPLAQEHARLASARWEEAGEPLRDLLRRARRQSDDVLADRAARLLLALEPSSIEALEHLAERTRSPELIIPHLHYLGRLARIDAASPRWRLELDRGERELVGE